MKKIVALLIVATMLFGMVGTGFAATATPVFSDIAGTKYEADVAKLKALGVVGGYLDGTFRAGENVTRSQFAVMVVNALDMGAAAKALAGVKPAFADVAEGYYSNGYINVAVGQGVISGYPDGTFKGENPVTYTEALIMLVRALGYKVTDPTSAVVKAFELELTDGVEYAVAAANRGDLAIMVANTVEAPKVKYVDGEEKDNGLMLDKLATAYTDVVVVDAAALIGSTLNDDKNEIKLNDSDSTKLEVASDINTLELVGKKVTLYTNDDDVVFFVKKESAWTIDKVSVAGDNVTLKDAEKTYTFVTTPTVFLNFTSSNKAALNGISEYPAKIYINSDNQIERIVVENWGTPIVVDEYKATKDTIYAKVGANVSGLDTETKNIVVLLNGKVAKLADIQENDLVYTYTAGSDYVIYVVRDTFAGAYEAKFATQVKVSGTKYDLQGAGKYSINNGDTFAGSDTDLLGETVTVVKDAYGKVYALIGNVEATNDLVGVAISAGTTPGVGTTTYWVKLYTAAGEKVTLTINTDKVDEVAAVAALNNPGYIFGYELDADGKIKSYEVKSDLTADRAVLNFNVDLDLDDEITKRNRINIDADANLADDADQAWKYFASDVVIFDATDATAPELLTKAKLAEVDGTLEGYVVLDGSKIEYLVITFGTVTTGSDDYYVFVNEYTVKVDGDTKVEYTLFGTDYVNYYEGAVTGEVFGDVVTISVDGDEATLAAVAPTATATVFDVDADNNRFQVTDASGDWILIDADTQVFIADKDAKTVTAATFADIAEDDSVAYYVASGDVADYVVIKKNF